MDIIFNINLDSQSVVCNVNLEPQAIEIPATFYNVSQSLFVTTTMTAGETLGGHRIVAVDPASTRAIYASSDNPAHAIGVVGMTTGSVNQGDPVVVQTFGIVNEAGWNWDMSTPRLFVGLNGVMTQTVPTSGFICQIATCLSPTSICIEKQQPIILS